MTTAIIVIFLIVYLGMMLGSLPLLKVDRAAIALLGAIAMVASGAMSTEQAKDAVGFSTLGLLFGLMIVSSNFDLAGLYSAISDRTKSLHMGPTAFLALVIVVSGVMSALLTNDVIAVALAPVLLGLCVERKLNPTPFLVAFACATNAGSIATIIGSPQNMLIGQHFHLSFIRFMLYTAVPALISMAAIWTVVALQYRDKWSIAGNVDANVLKHRDFDRWEAIKGAAVTLAVIVVFVFTDWRRDLVALTAGGLLLANAHFSSYRMLHKVDWQLLVLFIGLFVVNGAFQQTGLPSRWIAEAKAHGVDLDSPVLLYLVTAVLSDIVSNVPAVMLLLPFATDPLAGPLMAVASGLSSNLIVIGSLASIIVVDAAAKRGLKISFWDFARTGIPITMLTLLAAAGWLWIMRR